MKNYGEGGGEDGDEGGGEGSDEGVMKGILSCMRGCFDNWRMDEWTNIGDCRVAFETENWDFKWNVFQHLKSELFCFMLWNLRISSNFHWALKMEGTMPAELQNCRAQQCPDTRAEQSNSTPICPSPVTNCYPNNPLNLFNTTYNWT